MQDDRPVKKFRWLHPVGACDCRWWSGLNRKAGRKRVLGWSKGRGAARRGARRLDAGPMSDEELAWMRQMGVAVRDKAKLQSRGMGVADRLVNLVSRFGFRSTSGLGQPAGGSGGPSAP